MEDINHLVQIVLQALIVIPMDVAVVPHVHLVLIILIQGEVVAITDLLVHTVLDMVGEAVVIDQLARFNHFLDKHLEPLVLLELMHIQIT